VPFAFDGATYRCLQASSESGPEPGVQCERTLHSDPLRNRSSWDLVAAGSDLYLGLHAWSRSAVRSGSNFASRDGAGYERQMGRWSQRLASPFADFAEIGGTQCVLDMGCGTGSLTAEIMRRDGVDPVMALDYADSYVTFARDRIADSSFLVADGAMLPFRQNAFDCSVSQLVLHFVPDPVAAVGELRRVTRPGGLVAGCVWDAGGGVVVNRLFCDTAAAVDPGGEAFRQRIFGRTMTQPGGLAGVWRRTGLVDIDETTLSIRMDFASFDDYWAPYIGGDGPYAAFVSTLDDTARARLTHAVHQAYLGGRADGGRSFSASAWAVRGRVPEKRTGIADRLARAELGSQDCRLSLGVLTCAGSDVRSDIDTNPPAPAASTHRSFPHSASVSL
jgi:SAM-dependent methyltransferase